MASLKFYIVDLKRRICCVQLSSNYRLHKYLINDIVLPFGLKMYVRSVLYMHNWNSSKVRVRNRCIYTFRSRSVYSKFKLARSQLRENIWRLLIPGTTHASW